MITNSWALGIQNEQIQQVFLYFLIKCNGLLDDHSIPLYFVIHICYAKIEIGSMLQNNILCMFQISSLMFCVVWDLGNFFLLCIYVFNVQFLLLMCDVYSMSFLPVCCDQILQMRRLFVYCFSSISFLKYDNHNYF